MALTTTQRALALMGLVHDNTGDPLADTDLATRVIDAFLAMPAFRGRLDAFLASAGKESADAMTNAEKARFYLREVRIFHRQILTAAEAPSAGRSAEQAVRTEIDGLDLGSD